MSFFELGKAPLLTAVEEVELSRIIQAGMDPDATPQQKRRANKAKQRMVAGNIRLAVNVAGKFCGRCKHLDIEDLTQEAVFGLVRAAEKFDPHRGYKFSTYAYGWINQSIRRAINNLDQSIRVPIHACDQMTRFRHAMTANPNLTPSEAAALSETKINFIEMVVRARGVCSLNKILYDGSFELLDFMAAETPEDGLSSEIGIDKESLEEALKRCLPPRDAIVIRLYHGLDGRKPMSLAEVGRQVGLSREGVRQCRDTSYRRLRACFGSVAS